MHFKAERVEHVANEHAVFLIVVHDEDFSAAAIVAEVAELPAVLVGIGTLGVCGDGQRNDKPEDAAAADNACHPNSSAEELSKPAGDGQTEAGTTKSEGLVLRLTEVFKDGFQVFVGDTYACVDDLESGHALA